MVTYKRFQGKPFLPKDGHGNVTIYGRNGFIVHLGIQCQYMNGLSLLGQTGPVVLVNACVIIWPVLAEKLS